MPAARSAYAPGIAQAEAAAAPSVSGRDDACRLRDLPHSILNCPVLAARAAPPVFGLCLLAAGAAALVCGLCLLAARAVALICRLLRLKARAVSGKATDTHMEALKQNSIQHDVGDVEQRRSEYKRWHDPFTVVAEHR